jgi:spermidine/putrescine transport system substrate-binding protein
MSNLIPRPSRRAVVKSGLMLGGAALAAPLYVRRALASPGELYWFTWEDYAPQALVDKFQADTGITLNVSTFSSNEDQLNKLKAAGGTGWDIASPSIGWIAAHLEVNNLQAVDFGRLKNFANMPQSFLDASVELDAAPGGVFYAMPYTWGTEAVAFDSNVVKTEYGKLSYGDLWNPEYKGRMLARPRSIMLGTGLWMERTGELPAGTMRKAYDDEAAFDLGYGKAAEFVIANKAHIVNWWRGTADTQSGFMQDGAVIGMTWDGPIMQMRDQGMKHMKFMAPIEGALQWMDTIALTRGAVNIDQAYAFMDWSLMPENAGLMAQATAYNSVVKGFEQHVSESFRENFAMAYPGDALERLWLQGTERPWFLERRQMLVDRIMAA